MSIKNATSLKHVFSIGKLTELTRLKNKIENNSIWEDMFYQNEELKLTQVEEF